MEIMNKFKKQVEEEISLLVVDDEPNVISALKRILNDERYPQCYFTDPLVALAEFEKRRHALVISDNRMPVMTGLELLKKVKALSPHTSRILLTGQTESAEAIDAFNQKVIHRYVNKPWDNADLLLQIKSALDSFRYFRLKQLVENYKNISVQKRRTQNREMQSELKQAQTQLELSKYLFDSSAPVLTDTAKTLSVLVMDENADLRKWLIAALQKAGLNFCKAYSNRVTTLDHLTGIGTVDIILAEWSFKTGEGQELFKSLKAMPVARQPEFIALLPSDDNIKMIEEVLDTGVRDYLAKPFLMADLIRKLEIRSDERQLEKSSPATLDFSGYQVLIINKDTAVIDRLREVLSAEGIPRIKAVKSGKSAMSWMRQETISVILYDEGITDPHWTQWFDQLVIKRIQIDSHILIVTGKNGPTEEQEKRLLESRSIAFMNKPYSGGKFRSALDALHKK